MRKTEFEKDLHVDPLELDIQAAMQGELFFKWAEMAAEAKAEADRAKLSRDVIQAELFSKIKLDPERYGIVGRPTEESVNAAVRTHPKYLEAMEDVIECQKEAALLSKATDAMEQKKRMIEVLITLHGQSYFAGPSVPRDIASAFKEYQEDRNSKNNSRQRKVARTRKPKSE